MRLSELMGGETTVLVRGPAPEDVEVTGLSADSRTVEPGFLFAALPGARADGGDFIAEAVARGAAAVLAAPQARIPAPGAGGEAGGKAGAAPGAAVAVVTDSNPRRRFALMAARFFAVQPRTIAAVTGTNGKTSVASFTRQIWGRLGVRAASLGTLGLVAPGLTRPGALTTPNPVELHRILADLAADGVDHVVMEASSHGLDQFRLDGVRVTAAAFTNLSRDHLDYHRDMEAYFAAKVRLFEAVMAPGGAAVLNADVPEFERLAAACAGRGHRVIGYGRRGADVGLESLSRAARGQRLEVRVFGRRHTAEVPLAGAFQALNAVCALALAIACGGDEEAALDALAALEDAPGRMELVARHPSGAPVYVDYAHTPDALETVLGALRPHAPGRLVLVFGCGGDRDAGKRPLMAAIACRLADRVIVTDDNPRSEDPAAIRRQILAGVPRGAAGAVREIAGRAEAVAAAVAELEAGDLLVIAGKGHERGQIVGETVLPFDDSEAARAAVAALTGGRS